MVDNDRLSAKQRSAVVALVAGKTVVEAAADCHVSEITIYRWKREQAFRDGLHEAKQEMLDAALGKLVRYTGAAIDCLARNMLNDTGADAPIRSVQVRASQAILDATLTVIRGDEIDRRLKQLEERQG